jgi:general secretion pathway protein I
MKAKIQNSSAQLGFTLLEVIVALFILAITMGGLVKSIGDVAKNQSAIEERTLAQWVALNQIAKMRLKQPNITLGNSSGVEQMANRSWDWQQQIEKTPDASIYRVVITVSRDQQQSSVLARTIGYLWAKHE